jgi:hypothetical protein
VFPNGDGSGGEWEARKWEQCPWTRKGRGTVERRLGGGGEGKVVGGGMDEAVTLRLEMIAATTDLRGTNRMSSGPGSHTGWE